MYKTQPEKTLPVVTPIRKIIESAERKDLEAILIGLASSYDRIASSIRASLEPETLLDTEQIKRDIDEAFYSYCDRSGFIDYHDTFSFESDINAPLTSSVRSLLEFGRHMDAFDVSMYADASLQYNMDTEVHTGTNKQVRLLYVRDNRVRYLNSIAKTFLSWL